MQLDVVAKLPAPGRTMLTALESVLFAAEQQDLAGKVIQEAGMSQDRGTQTRHSFAGA